MKQRLLLWLVIAAGATACDLPTPAMPSYARDVRPIFLSHCIRCHGAGGTLQGDPEYKEGLHPRTCYLNRYDDEGCVPPADGTAPVGSATCKLGARSCTLPLEPGGPTSTMSLYLPTMPPAPSPALTDWELDIVRRWMQNPIP